MLVHPYRNPPRVVTGTRILQENFGLIGAHIREPSDPHRVWMIENVYCPLRRKLGGIRAKVRDQKDFVSFINQRDLEVLLGAGVPGEFCKWADAEYPAPGEWGWFGICADEDDLLDDLFDRELGIRAQTPGVIPRGTEIARRVHAEQGVDAEELWTLHYDADRETGMGPDPRLRSLLQRWSRIERERVEWRRC